MGKQAVSEQIWKRFISEGSLDKTMLNNEIMESWQLCRQQEVNPFGGAANCILTQEELIQRQEENHLLIHLYKTNIKRLQSLLTGWRYATILTDKEGYILVKNGENTVEKAAENILFKEGAKWDETEVGTNAIGLTKRLKRPITVKGYEHFAAASQIWNCSASPIFNHKDELIGILNISSVYSSINVNYVLSAVKLIADSISFDWKKKVMEEVYLLTNRNYSSEREFIICTFDKIICSLSKGIDKKYQRYIGLPLQTLIEENIPLSDVYLPILQENRIIGYRIPLQKIARFLFKGVKGKSSTYKHLLEEVEKVAPTNTVVHLFGETGTGKKLIAKTIHDNSSKAKQRFLSIYCGNITEKQLEEELFGCNFSLSLTNKQYLNEIEECTLFLDEIGELSSTMQLVVLQFLHQLERENCTNIRIITAASTDLRRLVEQGKMYKDLFYRIYAYPINIAPLRERSEDIESYVDAYFDRINWHPHWKNRLVSIFLQGKWPGNIRELHNILQRCEILYTNKIPSDNELYYLISCSNQLIPDAVSSPSINYKTKLEINRIKEALVSCNGKIGRAAKELNVSRATLYRKIKKYNLGKE
ncbi:MAG: sigma 54-interacting transcriptional regulator [Bacillus sp. (in: firmicutes)]